MIITKIIHTHTCAYLHTAENVVVLQDNVDYLKNFSATSQIYKINNRFF